MEVSKEKEIRDILIRHLRNAGIHVVTDIHEGQSVLNDSGFAVRMQSRLGQLKDIVDFIRTNLKRKRGGQMDIQVTEWVKKKSELEIGHRIKSHKIDIGGLNHGLNRHGINGSGINNKSIPLQKEDLELAPYILLCPDKITLGSRNNNLDSLVYEKRLSNGVIAYVEAEASLDGSVMVSKTMWADIDPHKMSPSLLVDARSEERPQAHVRNVIQSNDLAKIIKDAETAIKNEEILARADKLFVFSDKTAYGFVKNDTIYIDIHQLNVETPIHEYAQAAILITK